MINFPTSPVLNDAYTYLGRTWVWNGSGWERQINAGQSVSLFITPGTLVQEVAQGMPYTIGIGWHEVNYV